MEGKAITQDERAEIAKRLRGASLARGTVCRTISWCIGVDWNSDNAGASMRKMVNRIADLIESTPAKPSQDAHELADMLRRVGDGTNAAMFDLVWALKHEYGFSCGGTRTEEWRHDGFYAIAEIVERIAAPDMSAYVELPKDKDGVPTRPGDVLHDEYGNKLTVRIVDYTENGVTILFRMSDGSGLCDKDAVCFTHTPPVRTLDDVINDVHDAIVDWDSDRVEALMREAFELGAREGGER